MTCLQNVCVENGKEVFEKEWVAVTSGTDGSRLNIGGFSRTE